MLHALQRTHAMVPAALLAAALSPAVAWSQPAPQTQPAPQAQGIAAPSVDEARQHFELGVAAMQRQDWPLAFQEFETSGRLRRSAAVALNLGVVLREMHRLVEARVRLQEFNELATAQQHTQHDAQVQQMLTEISRSLGRLRVTSVTPASATVSIDGRRAQLNDAGETAIDPGSHVVRAEAQGYVTHDETIEVAESATREISFTLAAVPVETPHPVQGPSVDPRVAPNPAQQPAASRPIYSRWWFWTAIGVGAAAIGAGTAIAVVSSRGTRAPPATNAGFSINAISFGGAQ